MHLKNDELPGMFLLDTRPLILLIFVLLMTCITRIDQLLRWAQTAYAATEGPDLHGFGWVFALPYVTFSDSTRTPLLQDGGVFSFPGTRLHPCGRKINPGYLLRSVSRRDSQSHPLGAPTLSNSTKSPLHGVCLQGWPPAGQMPSIRSS